MILAQPKKKTNKLRNVVKRGKNFPSRKVDNNKS